MDAIDMRRRLYARMLGHNVSVLPPGSMAPTEEERQALEHRKVPTRSIRR